MSSSTNLFLILGTGRNGSQQIYKILKNLNSSETYHEFNFERILQLGIQKQLGYLDQKVLKKELKKNYIKYVENSGKRLWIDSSNALPWVAEQISEIWNKTNIIYLSRNGRKVISSFFYKFPKIMYPEEDYKFTLRWIKSNFDKKLMPNSSKIYWRPFVEEMLDENNLEAGLRFKMLCYYFNLNVEKSLNSNYENKGLNLFKFEDLLSKKESRNKFCKLLEIDDNYLENKFNKPQNIAKKINFSFTDDQEMVFRNLCKKTMERLDYSLEDDYQVVY